MRHHAVARVQPGDIPSNFGNHAGRLMTQDVRQRRDVTVPREDMQIGTANSAGAGFDQDFIGRDARHRNVFESQRSAYVAHDGGLHSVQPVRHRYRRLYTPPEGLVKSCGKNHG